MAFETSNKTATGIILGAVVVVLAGVVWYLVTDGDPFGRNEATITIQVPDILK
jgi:ABC-type transporter Mla subunit MlaD